MRFIHTGDWHLGRLLYGLHMTSEQEVVLEQFIDLVKTSDIDAVLIAGDIYDRSVPPATAVELLDHVLTRLLCELGKPVLMIAGNHDSPIRLNFGTRMFQKQGLHVIGTLPTKPKPIVLNDKHGPVAFHILPFAHPAFVRQALGCSQIHDHDSAMAAYLEVTKAQRAVHKRNVLMAHLHAEGGRLSESERPLSVWDDGRVKVGHFDDFNYVALGHLHLCQSLGRGHIHYSGSPLKYSFSEANETKSVQIIDMDAAGQCRIEKVSLSPRRDLRCLEGGMAELLKIGPEHPHREAYLKIRLLDKNPIVDAMGRLREIFPHLLHLERPAFKATKNRRSQSRDWQRKNFDELQLFEDFFNEATGESLTDNETEALRSVFASHRQDQREATL